MKIVGRASCATTAIILSLLPLPLLKLLDYANGGCGDGLCGFFSAALIIVGLGLATMFFLIRSAWRKETPSILRAVPVVLWLLAVLPLLF